MHLYSGRAKTLETFIGTVILLVLIATAVGVYRFSIIGIDSGAAAPNPYLPFKPVGDAETYNTDNLYEKIDGKAPMYQEVGFEKLTTQRYEMDNNSDLGLEVYLFDMGNAKNAFCVYSRQKRADGVNLSELQYGYKAGNAVYFSQGRIYVEMIGFAESQELIDAMTGFAEKLASQLPVDEKDKIKELEYFPAGTIAGSWKLQLKDAFGFDGLTDTYSALYEVNGKQIMLFLSKKADASEAAKVAKSYYDFLITNGAKPVSADIEILKAANITLLDFYGSTEIVFSNGVFVGGIHEADDRQAAQKAAEVLIERFKKINE
jgi:hypothetical protein